MEPSIYSFIKSEESKFETDEIQLGDNWFWNFRKHVQLIYHLKNGIFFTGENNWLRAFKNIMEPLLNLSYWTEDLEVKDVTFYIENERGRVLSFFVKKYYDEVYTRKHNLDTLFDEITESDLDYGGVLVQKTNTGRPEVLQLNTVAFCDQTDMLGGPMAFKMSFSPDKLRSMAKYGWGEEKNGATISLDELSVLATGEKAPAGMNSGKKNRVPGKTVEVYITHGSLPEGYLKDNDNMEDYYSQLQIVAFYINKDNEEIGVTLYRKKSGEGNIKFHTSKKVDGRALGRGVGETLVGPQVWTNFLTIHKMNLLESASKVPLYTDDSTYTQKNKIQDMENLEITTIEENKRIYQVPTAATANTQLLGNEVNDWYTFAQTAAAAQDPLMGKEAVSGTTFRGQERSIAQGRGIHDRRRGQRAKFIEELHREWIIPDMVKDILEGKQFMATLSLEELTWVQDQYAEAYADKKLREMGKDALAFGGKIPTEEDKEAIKQTLKESFAKKGNKHLLKMLGEDFRNVAIQMGINIANKQKDLGMLSDKILSIFQFIFSNPQGFQQAMQIPALAKSFQDILEYSGMSQADFMTLISAKPMAQPAAAAPAEAAALQLNQPQPVQ